MSNTYSGKVIAICPKKSGVSKIGNAWSSQDFVIEIFGQYTQKICFQIWGEEKINAMLPKIGDTVDVYFDIESREYNGAWYTTAKAWKIEHNRQQNTQSAYSATQNSQQQQVQAQTRPAQQASDANDDLPF